MMSSIALSTKNNNVLSTKITQVRAHTHSRQKKNSRRQEWKTSSVWQSIVYVQKEQLKKEMVMIHRKIHFGHFGYSFQKYSIFVRKTKQTNVRQVFFKNKIENDFVVKCMRTMKNQCLKFNRNAKRCRKQQPRHHHFHLKFWMQAEIGDGARRTHKYTFKYTTRIHVFQPVNRNIKWLRNGRKKRIYTYNDSNNTLARTHTHNYHTFSKNTRIIGKYQELIYYNHCYDNDTEMCCCCCCFVVVILCTHISNVQCTLSAYVCARALSTRAHA